MSSRPNTVEDWVKHLEGVRLPVATATAERLRRALADGRLALHEIAERLCESPPLALARPIAAMPASAIRPPVWKPCSAVSVSARRST